MNIPLDMVLLGMVQFNNIASSFIVIIIVIINIILFLFIISFDMDRSFLPNEMGR